MKVLRFGLVVMAVGLMTFGLIGTAGAFHSGGVAECGGCHSMHTPDPNGSSLLVGATPSETCLSCHEYAGNTGPSSHHISTADADMPPGSPPLQLTPGGDFGWLKKDYTYAVGGSTNREDGQTHGHNIIATNFGYTVDTDNPQSPGGTFDSNNLGCASCHDPHSKARRDSTGAIVQTGAPIIASGSYHNSPTPAAGQAVGVYRLLAGPLYTGAGVTFPGVPKAVAPSTYNRSEGSTQTRVAYGTQLTNGHASWGNWCGTCHGDMHTQSGNLVHPVDQPLSATKALYDTYVASGNMGGNNSTAYLSLVPFMENATVTYDGLKANATPTVLTGPGATDQVSCLSCHRAHASGWEYMLRWNMEGEFITYNGLWPGIDSTPSVTEFARGRTEAETRQAYYDRPATTFATYQRVLCNKCHAKD